MMVKSFDRTKYHPNIAEIIKQTIYNNPYILFKPYPRQLWPIFEVTKPLHDDEANKALIGAGGYGGKTFLGSMLAAQYLEFPKYSCLVTRLNYAELTGEDSIWENLNDWVCDENRLGEKACKSNESKLRITAPSGAKIWFKAFDHVKKKGKVKSESYDRIINDEASELDPQILTFIYRSLRSDKTSHIPLSMINLSNPGGPSTDYLCETFVDGTDPYYPLDWRHNPFINKKVYSKTLDNLDYIDQKYQKDGDWHYKPSKGDLITRERIHDQLLTYDDNLIKQGIIFSVISIDLAGEGQDKTAISNYLSVGNGWGFIEDLYQTVSPYPEEQIYRFIESKKQTEFPPNLILIEQEGGSRVYSDRHWEDELFPLEIPLYPITPKGSKYNRARPMVREMNQGLIKINKTLESKIDIESTFDTTYLDLLTDELLDLEPVMKKSPNLIDCLSQARNYLYKSLGSSYTKSDQAYDGSNYQRRLLEKNRRIRRERGRR